MLKKFPSNDEIQWHIGTAFQEAHHLWRDLGYVMRLSASSGGILPSFALLTHMQPTTADDLFCDTHKEWTIAGQGMGEWDEEDNMDNDGLGETGEDLEYVKLISQLEQWRRDDAKVSMDVQDMLNGVACTSLSLDIVQLTHM